MKVKLAVPVTPQWQRALARAAADRLAGRIPERIACRTWKIASGSGNPDHIVTIQSVVNLQATCDCIAAQRGLICRHAAAALDAAITRIAQSDAQPEPAPAAPLPPAPGSPEYLAAAEAWRQRTAPKMSDEEINRKIARLARL